LRRIDEAKQRERDRDAVAILQAELSRILAAQKALLAGAKAAVGSPELQRLSADEAALRRELERHLR
jgi:capsule polysaccharide export protein KpsE/RkpR